MEKRSKQKKAVLEKDLQAIIEVSAKGNRKALVAQLCEVNGLPVVERVEIVHEGWVGKPKGMLQILWERGFIDTSIEATKVVKL